MTGRLCLAWVVALSGLPLLPFLTRGLVLGLLHRGWMGQIVPEGVNDRDTHRTMVLALAGFSFSGLLAISVADATLRQDLRLSVYYLLVSFLSYFFALNLQGWKYLRWHDAILSDGLIEAASLSLLASVVAVVWQGNPNTNYAFAIAAAAAIVWLIDHVVRLRLTGEALRAKEEAGQLNTEAPRKEGIRWVMTKRGK